jgi:hypothetical protein
MKHSAIPTLIDGNLTVINGDLIDNQQLII